MGKVKKIILGAALLLAAISCTKEDLDQNSGSEATEQITLNVAINGDVADASSRVAIDEDWALSWEEDDALCAFYSYSYFNEFSEYRSAKFSQVTGDVFDKDNVTFTGEIYEQSDFRLIYPYASQSMQMSSQYSMTITSQEAGGNSTYMISEDMIEYANINEDVFMRHVGALVELTLTIPAAYNNCTISGVVVNGFNSSVTVDTDKPYNDADFYISSSASAITITDESTVVSNNTARVRFNIFPTTIASGESVTVILNLIDGTTLKQTITNNSGDALDFKRATYNTIGCDMSDCTELYWASSSYTKVFEGSGDSAESPYEISTAGELAMIAYNVNNGTDYSSKYFKLTENIDLSGHEWVAIGTSDNRFKGIFDGNDKKITGLLIEETTYYQGLFGYVEGATISNLSVSGSVSGRYYTGGVVGYSSSSSVTNCYNMGTVSGSTNTGGVVGYSSSSSSVTNCYNTGTVSGGTYTAGVVGYSTSTVTNCYNTGSVDGSGSDTGGVVGLSTRNNDNYPTYIINCYNTASVSGNNSTGGVVGAVSAAAYVVNCYNTGSIDGRNGYDVGGVAGYAATSYIYNCYSAASSISGGSRIGGVAGYSTSTVADCYWANDFYTEAYGSTSTSTEETYEKTSSVMKEEDFVAILNDYAYTYISYETCTWKAVSGDYPTLDFTGIPTDPNDDGASN